MPLAALYWLTDKVGGPESKSVTTGKSISSRLQHYPMIFGLSDSTADVLTCTPSLVSDKVVWKNLLEGLRGYRSGLLVLLSGRRFF
jgi:hypothetical protein